MRITMESKIKIVPVQFCLYCHSEFQFKTLRILDLMPKLLQILRQ